MKKKNSRATLTAALVMIGIVLLLVFVSVLRDYTVEFNGFTPTLVSRISIPRPSSLMVKNSEPRKLTLTTGNLGASVEGYEFRISPFDNMWFSHTYRSVDPRKEIGKLKPGKRYYMQVRCYKRNQMGRIVMGRWSSRSSSRVKDE